MYLRATNTNAICIHDLDAHLQTKYSYLGNTHTVIAVEYQWQPCLHRRPLDD
jgi:hypothetical protein